MDGGRRMNRSWIVLLLMTGCGPQAEPLTGAPASKPDEPDPHSWPPASMPDEPKGTTGEDEDEPPSAFIEQPDVSPMDTCDMFAQDCPTGEKCAWYDPSGGSAYASTRCVPIVPNPDGVGEPCALTGEGAGFDTCELGSLCWDVDPETNEGTCTAYCTGDASNPMCANPSHQCMGRNLQLCLSSCCPIEQDCRDGQGCYPVADTFLCAPDAGGESGAYLDSCEFLNVCDPGLFCANPEVLPPCEGAGCCAPFCEVGSTTCSEYDPALVCVPWFEEGEAPQIYEHTGACMVME